ncbi:MAG: hypothetical protein ACR2HH_00030 [Chthoniobacterales bacterium]
MKFRAVEIQHSWYERLPMRCLFALALARLIPNSLAGYTITNPNGLARFLDLTFLLNPAIFAVSRNIFLAALVLYALRLGWWLVLPFLTLFTVLVGTIINSQGAIGHYSQIVSLVLCAQTAAYFSGWRKDRASAENRVIFWSQQAIAATYLVSALTKLLRTSGTWILQSPKVAVQIIKTTEQDFYDRLDSASRDQGAAIADWMVHHPLLVALILGAGFFLELTTPLALLGRIYGLAYGLALIAFHEGIQRVMKLGFPFNEYLVAIYFVNAPFWIGLGARKLFARAPSPTSR